MKKVQFFPSNPRPPLTAMFSRAGPQTMQLLPTVSSQSITMFTLWAHGQSFTRLNTNMMKLLKFPKERLSFPKQFTMNPVKPWMCSVFLMLTDIFSSAGLQTMQMLQAICLICPKTMWCFTVISKSPLKALKFSTARISH